MDFFMENLWQTNLILWDSKMLFAERQDCIPILDMG